MSEKPKADADLFASGRRALEEHAKLALRRHFDGLPGFRKPRPDIGDQLAAVAARKAAERDEQARIMKDLIRALEDSTMAAMKTVEALNRHRDALEENSRQIALAWTAYRREMDDPSDDWKRGSSDA